jgi:hypothetical protein
MGPCAWQIVYADDPILSDNPTEEARNVDAAKNGDTVYVFTGH